MNKREKEALKHALHEINNALNAMSMQSELAVLYAEKGDGQQLQTVMTGIMKSCRRCSTISHELKASLLGGEA
jgi:C4-dicarboxylate-specific signal transduction histidine kinase